MNEAERQQILYDLHARLGRLTLQAETLARRIAHVKSEIGKVMNTPVESKPASPEKEGDKNA